MQKIGNIILFDQEELFLQEDVNVITEFVNNQKVNLIVFSDWFDKDIFCDIAKNIRPITECSHKINKHNESNFLLPNNLLSVNQVLNQFDIELALRSISGQYNINNKPIEYRQGTYLSQYPNYGFIKQMDALFTSEKKNHQFFKVDHLKFAVLGMFYLGTGLHSSESSGRLFIHGNTTCIDHKSDCLVLIDIMAKFLRK